MKQLLWLFLLGIGLIACTDKASTLRQRLTTLDKEFGGADVTDKKKAEEFIVTAEQLAGLVQKSSPDEYVDLLLKAAGLAKTVETYDKSLALYTKITETAPDHRKAPTAFFMIGYVYANDLKDLDKGKAAFELFLQKFPNDQMAEAARGELKNLGKSPEEVLKELLQNNPDSSNAVQ